MEDLPNKTRNYEVDSAVQELKLLDLGSQSDRQVGKAQAIGLLNVAESLQLLQLQIIKTSKENRVAIETQVDKLTKSNNEASEINKSSIRWSKGLTIALIIVTLIVGLLQAYVIWKTAEMQQISLNSQQIGLNQK